MRVVECVRVDVGGGEMGLGVVGDVGSMGGVGVGPIIRHLYSK